MESKMTFATTPEDPIREARRYLNEALKSLDAAQACLFDHDSTGRDRREVLIGAAHYASLAVTEILEAE
jgi:hypothetical protein